MARRRFEYHLRAFVLVKGCHKSAKSARFFAFLVFMLLFLGKNT